MINWFRNLIPKSKPQSIHIKIHIEEGVKFNQDSSKVYRHPQIEGDWVYEITLPLKTLTAEETLNIMNPKGDRR